MQSWIETSYVSQQEKHSSGSMSEYTDVSSVVSQHEENMSGLMSEHTGVSSDDTATGELQELYHLYIQMEYCPR